MVSATVLMAGLGAVMMIAGQVAYTPTASAKRLDAAEAVNEFGDDARYATYLVARSTHVLEFVVTDRDNDGAAERIRYEWSGVPGAPLLKTVNGGTPVALVDAVQDFQISVHDRQPDHCVHHHDRLGRSSAGKQRRHGVGCSTARSMRPISPHSESIPAGFPACRQVPPLGT